MICWMGRSLRWKVRLIAIARRSLPHQFGLLNVTFWRSRYGSSKPQQPELRKPPSFTEP